MESAVIINSYTKCFVSFVDCFHEQLNYRTAISPLLP